MNCVIQKGSLIPTQECVLAGLSKDDHGEYFSKPFGPPFICDYDGSRIIDILKNSGRDGVLGERFFGFHIVGVYMGDFGVTDLRYYENGTASICCIKTNGETWKHHLKEIPWEKVHK